MLPNLLKSCHREKNDNQYLGTRKDLTLEGAGQSGRIGLGLGAQAPPDHPEGSCKLIGKLA